MLRQRLSALSSDVRQYLLITGNYWAFTLTDGALRMLVVLHFHQLGYSSLEIALLFVFYEFFGVVTNLVGGWLGARLGLNSTMNIGLALQVVALAMLTVPATWLTVPWVMAAQALSGIAKDLNKMSAKSAVKLLVPENQSSQLYRWVALLTGSKNTLKGVGFFMGGALLAALEFRGALLAMLAGLSIIWVLSVILLRKDFGKASYKPKFTELLSKSSTINWLSAARLFLFAARDVWFVVALPVYLASQLDWSHTQVGSFLAAWVVFYGLIQSNAPRLTGKNPGASTALKAAFWLTLVPLCIATALICGLPPGFCLMAGLLVFALLFAINSSLHSYLIVHYAGRDAVSLDIGFYYMANAAGRLIGTLLSGWLYQTFGLEACLWASGIMIAAATLITIKLKHQEAIQADR